MAVTDVPFLRPPEVVRRSAWEDPHETRVANWIRPWDGAEPFDVGLLMVPIARGAIKHVGTHLGPNALRMVWPFFTTYSIDYDVDIARLRVRDLGDVEISLLDVPAAHRAIEAAAGTLLARNRDFFPITIGGEHSLAHPLLRAFKAGARLRASRSHPVRCPHGFSDRRARSAQRHSHSHHPGRRDRRPEEPRPDRHRRLRPGRVARALGTRAGGDDLHLPRRGDAGHGAAAGGGHRHRRRAVPTRSTSPSTSTASTRPMRPAPALRCQAASPPGRPTTPSSGSAPSPG